MLMDSILKLLEKHAGTPSPSQAEISQNPSAPAGNAQSFSSLIEEMKKTARSATSAAAAEESEGMKKIELEIAAAAGFLGPTSSASPEPLIASRSEQSLEGLLRTIEDLKNPNKEHSLDLFE